MIKTILLLRIKPQYVSPSFTTKNVTKQDFFFFFFLGELGMNEISIVLQGRIVLYNGPKNRIKPQTMLSYCAKP